MRQAEIRWKLIGRKGRDYFRKRNPTSTGEHIGIVDKPNYDAGAEIARQADRALQRRRDRCRLSGRQRIQERDGAEARAEEACCRWSCRKQAEQRRLHLRTAAEGNAGALLPRYVELQIYRALLESIAAYHAARMTAMDAASSNAERHDRDADA